MIRKLLHILIPVPRIIWTNQHTFVLPMEGTIAATLINKTNIWARIAQFQLNFIRV
jgi:hypothetical protein